MIDEARAFLELFGGEPLDAQQRLGNLLVALDRLSIAYLETPPSEQPPRTDLTPQDLCSPEVRQLVVRSFPDFGIYPTISPLADIASTPEMGDAIDDLVDIRAEMLEAVWRWENFGQQDAQTYFRWSYEIHWWRHLHDLRGYILAQIFRIP